MKNSMKVALALAALCFLSSSIVKDAMSTASEARRELAGKPKKPHRVGGKLGRSAKQNQQQQDDKPLYDETCPLALVNYLNDVATRDSNKLAKESGALEKVHEGFDAGAFEGRKVVFAGDSTFRTVMSSLSCLLHVTGHWKSQDSYMYGLSQRSNFFDARVLLQGGGELFFAPVAGAVTDFWTTGKNRALQSEEDWYQSCQDRKPFYFAHYKVEATNGEWFEYYSPDNPSLEMVELGKEDVVFFQGGHHSSRKQNLININRLMQCVKDAKAKGEDPGWPTLHYVRSTPQHFPGKSDGGYVAENKEKYGKSECSDYIVNDANKAEEDAILKRVDVVGKDLTVTDSWGRFHRHGGHDCTHYLQPGVSELYVREIVSAVMDLQ